LIVDELPKSWFPDGKETARVIGIIFDDTLSEIENIHGVGIPFWGEVRRVYSATVKMGRKNFDGLRLQRVTWVKGVDVLRHAEVDSATVITGITFRKASVE
jgi:hypothetical protein